MNRIVVILQPGLPGQIKSDINNATGTATTEAVSDVIVARRIIIETVL